jgi:energy-coupling factor transport system substrate-specific component
MNISNASSSFKLNVFDIVLTFTLAVALGVAFWGWTFVYDLAKPFLKIYGLNYLVAGFWILASVFVANIVRKPGVALLASLMAAFVQSLLTQWGLMSLMWGFIQGLGAEIIFFIFMYRKWNLLVLILASLLSSFLSYCFDFYYYDYGSMSVDIILRQLISFLVSSVLFAGVLTHLLSNRLLKLGILDQFLIAKN